MAWTANITKKEIIGGKISITVNYTNGITDFNEIYENKGIPSTNWIPNTVFYRLQQLDAQENIVISIPIGTVTPIDPVIPIIVSTSQTDWNERFRKLQMIDLLLRYNIIPTTDADIITLSTYLKTNWKTFIGI